MILNLILIPKYAAAGAAFGTMMAEIAVLIVQQIALNKEVTPAYKNVHYVPIVLGLLAGTAASFWVPQLALSSFFTLAVSAILFFGAYAIVLLLLREPLAVEVFGQFTDSLLSRRNHR